VTSPGPASSDTGTFSALTGDPKDAQDPGGLAGVREHFTTQEAVRVLSHYDLGIVARVREYRRGSRRAPKLRLTTEAGEYLLKRRAPARAVETRVALAHRLQRTLAERKFPIAPLVPTRAGDDGVWLDERSYELFVFVDGDGFSRSPASAEAGGAALARLHSIAATMGEVSGAPSGSFHAMPAIDQSLPQIPAAVAAVESDVESDALKRTCRLLAHGYREAGRRAESAGLSGMPRQIIHGDWHPGNLIYAGDTVAAVVDFDSVRLEPRISDVANGLLQFAMLMGEPDDPLSWPEGLDPKRVESFLRGYDQTMSDLGDSELSDGEWKALPWLMIESLIAEGVVPIAATGAFANIRGSAFLGMVERKVDWIWRRSSRLRKLRN